MILSATFSAARPSVRAVGLQLSAFKRLGNSTKYFVDAVGTNVALNSVFQHLCLILANHFD